jgi:hypothetical protein
MDEHHATASARVDRSRARVALPAWAVRFLESLLPTPTLVVVVLTGTTAVLASADALTPSGPTFVELAIGGLVTLAGLLKTVASRSGRTPRAAGHDAHPWIGGSLAYLGLMLMCVTPGLSWRPTLLSWSVILGASVPIQRTVLRGGRLTSRTARESTLIGWLLLSMTFGLMIEPVGWQALPAAWRLAIGVVSLPALAVTLWPLLARALQDRRAQPVIDRDARDPWGTFEGWILFGGLGWVLGTETGAAFALGALTFVGAIAATAAWTHMVRADRVRWATGPLLPAMFLTAAVMAGIDLHWASLGRIPVVNLSDPNARLCDYAGALALDIFALSLAHQWIGLARPSSTRRRSDSPARPRAQV